MTKKEEVIKIFKKKKVTGKEIEEALLLYWKDVKGREEELVLNIFEGDTV